MSGNELNLEILRDRPTDSSGATARKCGKPLKELGRRPSIGDRRRGRLGAAVSLLAVLVLLISQAPTIFVHGEDASKARSFERHDPVYTQALEAGGTDELRLPVSLRAVFPLPEGMDPALFVQEQPVVDMSDGYEHYDFYSFGYVAPKGAEQMYADGDKVIYTIYYAKQDADGQALKEVDETAYRLYGSIADSGVVWFSCDEAGIIDGIVRDVPVTWEGSGYDPSAVGEYRFTAKPMSHKLGCANPVALITVRAAGQQICGDDGHQGCEHDVTDGLVDDAQAQDDGGPVGDNAPVDDDGQQAEAPAAPILPANDCHCGLDGGPIDADNLPWAHQGGCIHFSPMECMCREMVEVSGIDPQTGEAVVTSEPGKYDHNHDPGNTDCPLYGKDTVDIIKLQTGERSVMAADDASEALAASAGPLYPALGRIEIISGSEKSGVDFDPGMRLLSINGGGANDVNGDAIMTQATPTSGSPIGSGDYDSGLPGSWRDYVNTIWMNKAYNKFAWTPAASTGAYNGWAWGGTGATQTSGTTQTNPLRQPAASGGVITVYSGEQLRTAMLSATAAGVTVALGGNINLNGSNYKWGTVDLGTTLSLILRGENKTLYNIGITAPFTVEAEGRHGWFVGRQIGTGVVAGEGNNAHVDISNLTFVTPKVVTPYAPTGLFSYLGVTSSVSNVTISSGLFFGGMGGKDNSVAEQEKGWGSSPFGLLIARLKGNITTYKNLNQLISQNNYIYANNHATGLALAIYRCTLSNSYAVGNLICSTGGHSGGFVACTSAAIKFTNCFSAAEIYGSRQVYGFGATANVEYERCYATGKLEGYEHLKGFTAMTSHNTDNWSPKKTCSNCYSTMLVGLRTESKTIEGFGWGEGSTGSNTIDSCYAAGEVGNTNTDMSNPGTIGGFVNTVKATTAESSRAATTYTNCYYDKQATAMREWVAGDGTSISGITGVLTSSTAKAGTGLASGSYGNASDKGFKGFSDNSKWVFALQHYPQLAVFANATSSQWGSAERADLVKAYSLASTATVFLNTWDEGYDWSDSGIRTASQVSYSRTLASTGKADHKGHANSYDTVREIVSDAPVTATASWQQMIPGGAPTDFDGDGVADGHSMDVSGSSGIKVLSPGMDWYRISETVNGQTGYRPIRLMSLMDVEAGQDRALSAGARYNHRSDVALTMMDKATEDLVVGLHDNRIWSKSKSGGYPNSAKYWAVPTTHLAGGYTASKDAWLYTEIWRAKQNADGSFVTDAVNGLGSEHLVLDKPVRVTGTGTGGGTTLSEKLWNGEIPVFEDVSAERKYLISYYWMLADGRYRSSTKTVTIVPGKYKLSVDVKNAADDSPAANKLLLGTAVDVAGNPGYSLSGTTLSYTDTVDIPYTQNAAAAWKKNSGSTSITKSELQFSMPDGTVAGTATLNGELTVGNSFTVPVKLNYNSVAWDAAQNANSESIMESTVNLSYTVEQDTNGGLFLRFNKLINPPTYELASATQYGSNAGIPGGTLGYINEMRYNVKLTLWVTGSTDPDFEFIKTDKDGNPLGGVNFELYACKQAGTPGHTHSLTAGTAPGNCWDVATPVDAQTSGADGKVVFAGLHSGDYMLVETKTLPGLQLPTGQWLLEVDANAGSIDITARGTDLPPAFKMVSSGSGYQLELPNYPVMTLPKAGGASALWFTVGGASLMAAAALLLFLRRPKPAPQAAGLGPGGPGGPGGSGGGSGGNPGGADGSTGSLGGFDRSGMSGVSGNPDDTGGLSVCGKRRQAHGKD